MEKLIIDFRSQALIPIFSSEDGHTFVKQRMFQDSETSGCNFFTAVGSAGEWRRCEEMKIDVISYLARKKQLDIIGIKMHLNSSFCNLFWLICEHFWIKWSLKKNSNRRSDIKVLQPTVEKPEKVAYAKSKHWGELASQFMESTGRSNVQLSTNALNIYSDLHQVFCQFCAYMHIWSYGQQWAHFFSVCIGS